MTATQHNLLMGAWKSAVASATGVIIANAVDTPNPLLSLAWFKHLGIAVFFVLLVTEARYWNQWANSGQDHPLPAALDHAAVANKEVAAAIDEAKAAVPQVPPVKP
jgi:hypothetical protein